MRKIDPIQRLWSKVDKFGPIFGDKGHCWLWIGKLSNGYGRFSVNDSPVLAHVFSYKLLVGEIPHGLQLDHLCRNRSCVNPEHLEPVTRRQNILRGIGPTAIHAVKTHCKFGHPFDQVNTRITKQGRLCRRCHADRVKRDYYVRKGYPPKNKPKGRDKGV